MGRHVGISSIDLRLVETGFDDGDLGVIRDHEVRDPGDRFEGVRVCTDPIAEALAPGRLRVHEVGCAHDSDEDLRFTDLPGQSIDEHRYRVAGVIDEQLLAAHMGLAHGDRELSLRTPDIAKLND